MTNLPPFFPGQRIVAIKTVLNKDGIGVVKGKEYTVRSCSKTCKCANYMVCVGLVNSTGGSLVCMKCGVRGADSSTVKVGSQYFAPITENFQSISLEKVLETETPLISVN